MKNKVKFTTISPDGCYEAETYIQLPMPDRLRSIGETVDEGTEPFEVKGHLYTYGPATTILLDGCHNCKNRRVHICRIYSDRRRKAHVNFFGSCYRWEEDI